MVHILSFFYLKTTNVQPKHKRVINSRANRTHLKVKTIHCSTNYNTLINII